MEREDQKLEYLLSSLTSQFNQEEYPEYSEFLKLYFRYLDENYYSKIINILDNNDFTKIFSSGTDYDTDDILYSFFAQYFNGIIPEDLIQLKEDNERLFIRLSKLINNYKGCSPSFNYLFEYLGEARIIDDSGTVSTLGDLSITMDDFNKSYWEINTTLDRFENPFTYLYTIQENEVAASGLNTLVELLYNIHPAGFQFSVGYPIYPPSGNPTVAAAVSNHCIMYSNFQGFKMDGEFSYSGTLGYEAEFSYEGTTYSQVYNVQPINEIEPHIASQFVDSCTPPPDYETLSTQSQGSGINNIYVNYSTFIGFQYNAEHSYDTSSFATLTYQPYKSYSYYTTTD